MALEPVVKAVLAGDAASRVAFAQLISATTVNTVYAAYAFYQDRKGGPLTAEEMEEIKTKVTAETMDFCEMLVGHLGTVASESMQACG